MARDAVPTLFTAVEAASPRAPISLRKPVRSGTFCAEKLKESRLAMATDGALLEASA